MKQNKVLLNRMEKEVYSRKQTLLMLLFKICEHCLTPIKGESTIEEVNKNKITRLNFLLYAYIINIGI